GLHRFVRITVRNTAGKIMASHVGPFCVNSVPQRSSPDAPRRSPFPLGCPSNGFQLSNAWGIQRGWGVDAGFIEPRLRLGRYTVTVRIIRFWQRVLHLSPRNSTAMVKVKVVKPGNCGPFQPCAARPASRHPVSRGALPQLPANVPTLTKPPTASLPDLVPLPSWGIRVFHIRTRARSADVLTFGATVWSGGRSRLDVEGFRSNGSPLMRAYQYFWKNGRIIG